MDDRFNRPWTKSMGTVEPCSCALPCCYKRGSGTTLEGNGFLSLARRDLALSFLPLGIYSSRSTLYGNLTKPCVNSDKQE